MRFKWLVCVLLLLQWVTGCATMYTSNNVGYNHDNSINYSNVYSDGERLVFGYNAPNSPSDPLRWAAIDMKELKWSPLGGVEQPIEFTPRNGRYAPGDIEGLKEISLHRPQHNSTATFYSADPVGSGELHKSDARRYPFTAYAEGQELLLIRNGIDGHLETVKLEPRKDLSPVARMAAYPFAVAFDVVTSPLQLIFFGLFVVLYHGA